MNLSFDTKFEYQKATTSQDYHDKALIYDTQNSSYQINRLSNIAKGTTDPRVEFMSQVITQILIKQFQNFD